STLLKLINGDCKPNSGNVVTPIKTEIFPFNIENEKLLVRDVVKQITGPFLTLEKQIDETFSKGEISAVKHAELISTYNDIGGYQIDALIEREFRKMDLLLLLLEQRFETLSGGEKTKVMIISLFLKGHSFLLIDEPTNHLDTFGRVVLAEYLKNKTGFILVSHDQEFLDICVNHILSINKNSVTLNSGGFTKWNETRLRNEERELNSKEKLQDEAYRLENSAIAARGWSSSREKGKKSAGDSGFEGKRSAKMMKRAKSMERRRDKRLDEVKLLLKDYENIKSLEIKQDKLLNKKYLKVQDLSYEINGNAVFQDISFELAQGDRIWIKGENGSGKTTLLKIISGEIGNYSGIVKKYNGISVIHSHQNIEQCDVTVEEYREMNNSNKTAFIRNLDYFGMNIDHLEKPIELLSEGEKKKVEIAKTLASTAELYLWDEILNYMDIYFRLQLEEAVVKYNPTLIFVTHDVSFGSKIATKVIELSKQM
ncbi:ABC-F family ATP-binding cassette domain-containing protein, partial [bacterium AH-315-G05]|nr:ABC-F family ATP-binding cassette domain-containing protein [bacterium AH-315-G05]